MKICIDLCSGLGGFSQAFVDAGWEVIRVDNNPKFKPDILSDVRDLLHDEQFLKLQPDVILASPPCNHFSVASLVNGWPREGIMNALEVVGACLEVIAMLKPRVWFLENPRGMLRRVIGRPRITINQSDYDSPFKKPTDLWSNWQIPMIEAVRPYEKTTHSSKMISRQGVLRIRDPAERSKIPYRLSKTILETIENQNTPKTH